MSGPPFTSSQFYGKSRKRKKERKISLSLEHKLPTAFPHRILGPTGYWKTFYRQTEAFEWAKKVAEDVYVFAFESGDGDSISSGQTGKRRYLATSLPVFWHYYSQLEPSKRHHYEIIPEGCPCKLYFDLEFMREFNPGSDGDKMVDILVQYVCCWLKMSFNILCDRSCVLDLNASTSSKFSRHLIFHLEDAVFENCVTAGNFVRHIFGLLVEYLRLKTGGNGRNQPASGNFNKENVQDDIYISEADKDQIHSDLSQFTSCFSDTDDDELNSAAEECEQSLSWLSDSFDATGNTKGKQRHNSQSPQAVRNKSMDKSVFVEKQKQLSTAENCDTEKYNNSKNRILCVRDYQESNGGNAHAKEVLNIKSGQCIASCHISKTMSQDTHLAGQPGNRIDNEQNVYEINASFNGNNMHFEHCHRNNKGLCYDGRDYQLSETELVRKHELCICKDGNENIDEQLKPGSENNRDLCTGEKKTAQTNSTNCIGMGGGRTKTMVDQDMAKICEQFSLADLQSLMVTNKDGNMTLFCDLGVYTKNRNFRLYLSSKLNKSNPLLVAKQNQFVPPCIGASHDTEQEIFYASLVSSTRHPKETQILHYDCSRFRSVGYQNCSRSSSLSQHEGGFSHKEDYLEGHGCSSPYPEIDMFIQSLVSFDGRLGKVRHWTYFLSRETLIYDISGYRWCGNVQREHRSNNIMYVVDLQHGLYYQKCHDPDCQAIGYKSDTKDVPYHLLPASYFENDFESDPDLEMGGVGDSDSDADLLAAADRLEEQMSQIVGDTQSQQTDIKSLDSVFDTGDSHTANTSVKQLQEGGGLNSLQLRDLIENDNCDGCDGDNTAEGSEDRLLVASRETQIQHLVEFGCDDSVEVSTQQKPLLHSEGESTSEPSITPDHFDYNCDDDDEEIMMVAAKEAEYLFCPD